MTGSSIVTTVMVPDDQPEELLECVFYGFTLSLIRSSASQIYLVPVGKKSEEVVNLVKHLPDLLAYRVKVIDLEKKTLELLHPIMAPIYAEADFLWNKEHAKDASPGHEHTACMLYELLHLLVLGQVYQAEVDFDVELAMYSLLRLQKRLHSPEACASIARIEGIINSYSPPTGVACLVPSETSQELRTGSLLQDLVEDARWLRISAARYQTGIVGKFHHAYSNMKRNILELLKDPKKRRYLSYGEQIITAALEKLPIPIPLPQTEGPQNNVFSPHLLNLHDLKPHCIGTGRWFPFSQSEVGTDRYLRKQKKICPVSFLFKE